MARILLRLGAVKWKYWGRAKIVNGTKKGPKVNFMFNQDVYFEPFSEEIYKTMLDQTEMWFVTMPGFAHPIMDASLMDC